MPGSGSLLLATAACAGLLSSCTQEAPAAPRPPAAGVILEVDGLRVTRQEVEAWHRYVQAYRPTAGKKSITRFFLEQHLLPLKAAQREFPEQRAEALGLARNLRSVAGNSLELQRKAALLRGYQAPESLLRINLEPGLVAYAFAAENIGRVSDPIETPRGILLAASINLTPGGTSLGDRVELCRVNFWTQDDQEYGRWFAGLRDRLKGKVTYLDPEYQGALPRWLLK